MEIDEEIASIVAEKTIDDNWLEADEACELPRLDHTSAIR